MVRIGDKVSLDTGKMSVTAHKRMSEDILQTQCWDKSWSLESTGSKPKSPTQEEELDNKKSEQCGLLDYLLP